jgi:prepilin-type N-terminal cleavage/methylation domain-containing protein
MCYRELYVKKRDKGAFSLVEVIVAVSMFSIAAVVLTISVANGLLCRRSMVNHDINFFEYAFVSHIVQNSASIHDATRISKLTLPDGRMIQTKIAIIPTDSENLFLADITIDKNQYKSLLANKNWQ